MATNNNNLGESELPGYSSLPPPDKGPTKSEYQCSLEAKGRKWITLFVKSRAKSSTVLPLFLEGEVISGHVELDLDKTETIKGITIEVKAGTTFVGQEEEVFLNLNQVLWTPNGSGPKIKGKHSWDYSFILPKTVQVKEPTGGIGTYDLPPQFSERASPAYIVYKLVVTIKRAMLRVNDSLEANFTYLTLSSPDPPSALRQLSYVERSPLVGPEGDPEGWKVLPSVKIKGVLFGTNEVELDCILSIATPLCYTVGSPIPLMLSITSQNTQALDLLAQPNAIRIRLVRTMATGSDATVETQLRRTNNYFVTNISHAYFWPSMEGAKEENKRILEGEIEVTKGSKQSFLFPRFTIRYFIDFFPFEAPGFALVDVENDKQLLSEQVTIVLKHAAGVTPVSHAPPGYEKPQGVDYNKSVGLLENGNQRFFHHSLR